jgi:hypothetical protein
VNEALEHAVSAVIELVIELIASCWERDKR